MKRVLWLLAIIAFALPFQAQAKKFRVGYLEAGEYFSYTNTREAYQAELKKLGTYHEMLNFAADNGFYMGTHRAIDNEVDAENMGLLWELDIVQLDDDPCIKYRVGEKVCELSGLTAYIDDVNKKEIDEEIEAERMARELENTIDGDDPDLDLNVTIGQLQEDAAKAII